MPVMPRRRATAMTAMAAALACTAALTVAVPAPAMVTKDQTISLIVDGRVRTARVHVPNPMPDPRRVPLVLAFHGLLGNGDAQQSLSHFNEVANEKGFLAVYPDGYQRSWNDGRKDTPSNRDGVRDVRFVRALLSYLEKTYPVDRRRVFALGMSNGGFFAQRLGCVMAKQFAAIATVAAVFPKTSAKRCRPSRPLSVLMIMGTADPLVPYRGGRFGQAQLLSAKASAALWRERAGCKRRASSWLPDTAADGTRTRLHTATHCKRGAAVKLYAVQGGGHTWPGGAQYLPAATIGRTSRDFDASRTIWAFFGAHGR
ncbi:MAG TPA: PHB depolymerase family esterase [Sporichthya sp.]|nr:PHB depolymerase family esterase [Sporichthya sp.]